MVYVEMAGVLGFYLAQRPEEFNPDGILKMPGHRCFPAGSLLNIQVGDSEVVERL